MRLYQADESHVVLGPKPGPKLEYGCKYTESYQKLGYHCQQTIPLRRLRYMILSIPHVGALQQAPLDLRLPRLFYKNDLQIFRKQ